MEPTSMIHFAKYLPAASTAIFFIVILCVGATQHVAILVNVNWLASAAVSRSHCIKPQMIETEKPKRENLTDWLRSRFHFIFTTFQWI